MERSPEAARVAEAIRAEMDRLEITPAELGRRIERLTGTRPGWQWLTRHTRGQVHLTRPVVVRHAPNEDLELIAKALGVDAQTLADAADDSSTSTA